MSPTPHPWPTPLGAENAGGAPVPFGGQGGVRWSVEVPARAALRLVASADGRWTAGGADFLAGGDARGVRWRHDMGGFVALAGDHDLVVARVGGELAVVDGRDGTERWSRPGGFHLACPALGGVAALEVGDAESRAVHYEDDGRIRWTRPVEPPTSLSLLARGDALVYAAGHEVVAFDATGEPRWRAGAHTVTTHPFVLDERRLAIGVNAHEWRGWLLMDAETGTAAPWRMPNGTMVLEDVPVAVRRVAGLPLALVTRQNLKVMVVAIDGSQSFTVDFPALPAHLAVDATGAVAVVHTYAAGYYDKYTWHDEGRALRERCGVTVLEPDGRRRWTWDAPGPVAGLAVGAGGEILVTSEGRLWAIG